MLKLRHIYFAAVGLGLASAASADEQRYVSDDLLTYIHSGPGNQYRIVGTLNSGDAVTLISQNDDAGFAQVRDEKGRTAWIPLDQLSAQPSLRTRVPALEQQVQDLTQKLNTLDAGWNQRTADMQKKVATSDGVINDLKEQNQALKDQLTTAQKKVNAAAVQLDDKQRTIIMQWFMYGGAVAGVGLLLGLLLPHIIPRRKKRQPLDELSRARNGAGESRARYGYTQWIVPIKATPALPGVNCEKISGGRRRA